ncbi:Cytochrome b reductase 1 [Fasciolopsis buskii]|uniref:Cytochrome b reductase 1 n=1 Tax=Fasciolopsis buskii TaxID=27845 RepID=A0A8E0RJT6_9TREM|nr:Cytochrome b reductase 1 [Fasciolopsis buski]
MDAYDPIEPGSPRNYGMFMALVVISQILGIICVILTGAWLGAYWGGFSWTDSRVLFNYHPLFMVLGLVFLYGDAILVYRVFRNYRKLPIKVLHAVLHILAFLFAVVAVKAVFEFHDSRRIPNLYSLHSWIGLVALVLFGVQWVSGLITFLVPQMPQGPRAAYLPIHVSFGSGLFILIIGVCISGITEKNIFSQARSASSCIVPIVDCLAAKDSLKALCYFSNRYPSLETREVLGNALGVCLVCFGAVIYYLITHPAYRRVELVSPERRALNQQ